jgi:hypothetical protein
MGGNVAYFVLLRATCVSLVQPWERSARRRSVRAFQPGPITESTRACPAQRTPEAGAGATESWERNMP